MAKPCTPQPIAQRVQLFKRQSRNVSLSLGDIKGVFSFAKENTPPLPHAAPSALPSLAFGKRKSTTTFVVMLYGAGDEARSRHCRAVTRTAGGKRPTGAFSRFARALFEPLSREARTRFPASREPPYGDSWEPCLTSDPMRLRRGWRQRALSSNKKTGHPNRMSCLQWSGRRGSNSLPPPWQGGALPDELRPRNS